MTAWALDSGREWLEPVHGGPGPGGIPEATIDFSTSINPFGPAPAAAAACVEADPAPYPDPASLGPREAAARVWGLDVATIRFAGGATTLLHDAALAWIEPGDVGIVPEPSFGEYARAVALARGRVVRVPPTDRSGSLDLEATLRAVRTHDARIVFLGRPNTPTGEVVDEDQLAALVHHLPQRCLLVLDESFLSFHAGTVAAPPALGVKARVLGVRSVTKDCGLAGLRAGFAVGPSRLLGALDRVTRPWSASAPAQAAAAASLAPASVAWLDRTLRHLATETEAIARALAAADLEPRPTRTNFVCADVPGGADALTAALETEGLRIRGCASFGMPGHVRVGAQLPGHNRRLIGMLDALASEPRGGGSSRPDTARPR